MSDSPRAPRPVRAAGALVGVQALTGLVFALALVVRAFAGADRVVDVLAEAGYFLVLCSGVLAAAIALLRGRRWARTPAVVVQLLLLGVAWYLINPSGQYVPGGVLGFFCLAVLVLLFTPASREWAARAGTRQGHSGPA